ncbi:MAG: KpsF/GutQ family sugar-phosphate isomerase [Planctomycetes bacterium]|nr:KpsF/GutQ family sugar-phosphate isomerase [Planctomycetota bacterium]
MPDMPSSEDLAFAVEVLRLEASAVEGLTKRLGEEFLRAVSMVLGCCGRVVVSGVGKAGIIAQKIAATFASTGTPALFLHPTEALHGDLGMVVAGDVALLLSNSGQTAEIMDLLPHLRKVGASIMAVTGNPHGPLMQDGAADVVLDIGAISEACPLGLAPSCSTTAMLALGDALALTVQRCRGFTGEDYVRFHPAGALGRRLLKVSEVMRTGERLPLAAERTPVGEVISAISRARAGSAPVVDEDGKLLGIFTDGDFRRMWTENAAGMPGGSDAAAGRLGRIMLLPVGEVMTSPCLSIEEDRLAAEAMRVLGEKRINELPVVNRSMQVTGIIDVQDLVGLAI